MIGFNSYSAKLEDHITTCPCCKGNRWKSFANLQYSHGKLRYQICSNCGLIFQSPQMSTQQREEFYAENYRVFAFGQVEPPQVDIDIQNGRAEHLAGVLQDLRIDLQGHLHLDIGCGSGAIIKKFKEIHGCLGVGVEPDVSYREYAQSQGLDIYESLDEWQVVAKKKVKIVTLSHVLEHLPEPLAFLTHIKKDVLADGGLLLVEVPHLYFHPYFDLAHLLAFSPHTIRQIIRLAGFEILYFKQHGRPVRRVPRYMTVLAQSIPPQMQRQTRTQGEPRGVRIKRYLGLSLDYVETKALHIAKRARNLAGRLSVKWAQK